MNFNKKISIQLFLLTIHMFHKFVDTKAGKADDRTNNKLRCDLCYTINNRYNLHLVFYKYTAGVTVWAVTASVHVQ